MVIGRYNLDCGHQYNYSIQVMLNAWYWCLFPPGSIPGTMIAASIIPVSQHCSSCDNIPHFLFTLILSRSNGKSSQIGLNHPSCQWVLLCSVGSVDQALNWHTELIGTLDKSSQLLTIKCSDNVNEYLERTSDHRTRGEQPLTLTSNEW